MIRWIRFMPRRWWSPKAWRTWASYMHWRLETYGVFYPAGKTNWKALRLMLQQLPSYSRWVGEMERLRQRIPSDF